MPQVRGLPRVGFLRLHRRSLSRSWRWCAASSPRPSTARLNGSPAVGPACATRHRGNMEVRHRSAAADPAWVTCHRGNMEVRHRSAAAYPAWATRCRGKEIEVPLPIYRCRTRTWTPRAEGDATTQGEHMCDGVRSQKGYHRDAVLAVPLTG
jgi:hypothetical protein